MADELKLSSLVPLSPMVDLSEIIWKLDMGNKLNESFAFAHYTTCKSPYYLRVHGAGDRKWRTLKFRFFFTRDIVITALAYMVYSIDSFQQSWLRHIWGFDSEITFYYMCEALLFFALLGLSGCFITCYEHRVRNDLAQPCRELCTVNLGIDHT